MPLVLVVNTATPVGGIALVDGSTVRQEILFPEWGTHTDHLLPSLERLLEDQSLTLSRLDGFSVLVGPGSFTGLRVGLGTVKGLAMTLSKPVLPLSSLEVLAAGAGAQMIPVCALLDARKQEVYAALFMPGDGGPQRLTHEAAVAPDELLKQLPKCVLLVGSGALLYRNVLVGGERMLAGDGCHVLRPGHAAALVEKRWLAGCAVAEWQLEPSYLRLSEAENQRLKRMAPDG